jgi:archaeal flagellin FlaB
MKSNGRKFQKNNAAFTGLEAAIVLIAFVVVAAVFSYVMLGAGFFTSQKSKEVVHTGVDQATSSVQLSGDVVGQGSAAGGHFTHVFVTLSLTAGNNPVDMSKLAVSYTDSGLHVPSCTISNTFIKSNEDNTPPIVDDGLLDQFEKVKVDVTVPAGSLIIADGTAPNARFTLEFKPAAGAILPITLTAPPTIQSIMILV